MSKKTGWAKHVFSPKWHYFVREESICKRYTIHGTTSTHFAATDDGSPKNCGTCRLRLKREIARKAALEPIKKISAFAHIKRSPLYANYQRNTPES